MMSSDVVSRSLTCDLQVAEWDMIGLVDKEYLEESDAHDRACLHKNGYCRVREHKLPLYCFGVER
jgi:hypothetical protein